MQKKAEYPHALVLAHPECPQEVTKLADYVGSTTGIMKFAKESKEKEALRSGQKSEKLCSNPKCITKVEQELACEYDSEGRCIYCDTKQ